MIIRIEDIEPKTLERLMAALHTSYANPTPSPAELHARQLDRQRFYPPMWKSFLLAVTTVGGGFLVGLPWLMKSMASPVGLELGWALMSAGAFIVGILGGVHYYRQFKSVSNRMDSEVLSAWLPLLDLTPSERAYCETIALLSETSANLDETTQRDLLAQLNTLMTQYRHLDAQREAMNSIAGAETLAGLEAEQTRLTRLVAETGDAQARETLQASLNLCQSRLGNARALTQTRERLDAQQELLLQTLASIRDSLTRNKTASVPLSLPDAEEIQNSVRDINLKTTAVETAVQEVLTLQNRA